MPPRTLVLFQRNWRLALFALAVVSVPFLWLLAGDSWNLDAGRRELDRAREAWTARNFDEAGQRAERLFAGLPATRSSPEDVRLLAAEAALLSARATLDRAALEELPAASLLRQAALRATQAAELGGDAPSARLLRVRAARGLRQVGRNVEAIREFERLQESGPLDLEASMEMATALSEGNDAERARALVVVDEAMKADLSASERVQARLSRGRILARSGRHAEAVLELGAVRVQARSGGAVLQEEEARLEQGRALVALDRLSEAAPLLRELLLNGITRSIREEAGVSLVEADAGLDETALPADLADLERLPASPESLFAARARAAHRRLRLGRRADAALTYAAAFDHLGTRPWPERLFSSSLALADLERLDRYGLDANDLPALSRAAEGCAACLPESERALELSAGVASRRAALADEKRAAAEQAGSDAGAEALEARVLHGRAGELYALAADGRSVLKSRSTDNRFFAARELFRGDFHATSLPLLVRLSRELAIDDPRGVEVHWMHARSLQQLGRHGEAVTLLNLFLQEHLSAPTWSHDAFVALARSQESLGQFEAAEATLNDFLFRYDNVTPDSPRWRDALFALGDLQARMANDARADENYEEAARLAARAERNLADAVRRFPTAYAPRFKAEYRLGLLAMSRRGWNDAATRFRNALDMPGRTLTAPRDPEVEDTVRRASLLLGECLFQMGRPSDALSAFGQAWTSRPGIENVLALQRIAECHALLDDPRQAERFQERAKEALAQFRARKNDGREIDRAEEKLLERLMAVR